MFQIQKSGGVGNNGDSIQIYECENLFSTNYN